MARSSSIARRYAEAYFQLAEDAGDVEGWRRELGSVTEGLTADRVAATLVNPRLSIAERMRLGLELLDGVSPQARNLARLLIERSRTALLPEILDHYDQLVDAAAGVVRAEVVTAVPVDARTEKRIADSLTSALGSGVETVVRTDPSIGGGLVIRIGDRVIDDSVRTHLQQLQAALA